MKISSMEASSCEELEKVENEFKFKVPRVPCVRKKSSKPKVEKKVTEIRRKFWPMHKKIEKYKRLTDFTMKKINELQYQLGKCDSLNDKIELLKLITKMEKKHWAYVESYYRCRLQLRTNQLNKLILEESKTFTS